MIQIELSGQTYLMKQTLKKNGFMWIPKNKTWIKSVGVSLDHELDKIRPGCRDTRILVKLTEVDMKGKQISDRVMKFRLKHEDEKLEGSYLQTFLPDKYHLITKPSNTSSTMEE